MPMSDFANPQLPSVASMANPLGGPGRGSSLGSETHPAFFFFFFMSDGPLIKIEQLFSSKQMRTLLRVLVLLSLFP